MRRKSRSLHQYHTALHADGHTSLQKHRSCQRKGCVNQLHLFGLWNRTGAGRMQSSLRGSVLLLLCLCASCTGAPNSPARQGTPTSKPVTPLVTPQPMSPPPSTTVSSTIHHYEYVFPDG